jgi:hypothetical protein
MFTPYEELDEVLTKLVAAVRGILGDTFVGAYLQGSFALGAGDMNSDCDFIIAVSAPPHGAAEAALRRLHDEIPTRPGHWTKHLEGSYADVASLRSSRGLGTPWLYCDHGHRELIWDTHCNSLHTRWILRNRGIVLNGPPIADLVDEVSSEELRASMREALQSLEEDLLSWLPLDVAWSQRYLVSNFCRVLYTLDTAEIASKRGAMEWAHEHLDPKWRPLLEQCIEDRALGWNPGEPPRPGSLQAAFEFAGYAKALGQAEAG